MSKDLAFENEEKENRFYRTLETIHESAFPALLKITPAQYHEKIRSRILEDPYSMFTYLEAIQFFCKLRDEIFGAEKREGDKELITAIRDELAKHGGQYTSPRGIKFEPIETGTRYDYTQNADWMELNMAEQSIAKKRKALEERLKSIPPGKAQVDTETGETLIGPAVSSKSSIKITLPKK